MFFASCNKDENVTPKGKEVAQGTEFSSTIAIHKGVVTISGDEMKGGGTTNLSPNDLLAIEITENKGDALVASGLFIGSELQGNIDNPTTKPFNVTLKHGVDYTIQATLVKDAQGVALDGDFYGSPFLTTGDIKSKAMLLENWQGLSLTRNTTFKNLKLTDPLDGNMVKEADRWYFENNSFTADYKKPALPIELRRTSFKTTFDVTNISPECTVKAWITRMENIMANPLYITLTADVDGNSKNVSKIYTLPEIDRAYRYSALGQDFTTSYYVHFKVYDGTTVLKEVTKMWNPKPNKVYNIQYDALTDKDNPISIILNDNWGSTENLSAE